MAPKLRMGAALLVGGLCLAVSACGNMPAADGDSPPPPETATSASQAPAASASSPTAASGTVSYMLDWQFWDIIEESLERSQGDSERQAADLEEILASLPPAQVASFDATFRTKAHALYAWELWGAAYVLLDGCSDDCFDYFRNWVVGQGGAYHAAVSKDPLVLGNGRLTNDSGTDYAELFTYAIEDAYARASDWRNLFEDHPGNPVSVTGSEPLGDRQWDEDNVADFYPELEKIRQRWAP